MADDNESAPIIADTLALALVASSDAPILLLDGNLAVIAVSASFTHAFQVDPANAAGRSIFSLGAGEWDVPQLRSLLRLTLEGGANVGAYEIDLKPVGRDVSRLVITAHQLVYDDPVNRRLLVAVSDVTDARLAERLKDDLLREKAVLYQELQHRIANSLQIIASVLMQSARRVNSEQTRNHLFDALSRVLSVAARQRQLVASNVGEVRLSDYFAELCKSISDSMIQDPERLRLTVEAHDGFVSPESAVSLGLIVTELVINALKHAFPHDGGGDIFVSYGSDGSDWSLSVIDNGVGMPSGAAPRTGLGTSLVEALAKQLGATVVMSDALPGASVSIVHKHDDATSVGDLRIHAPQ